MNAWPENYAWNEEKYISHVKTRKIEAVDRIHMIKGGSMENYNVKLRIQFVAGTLMCIVFWYKLRKYKYTDEWFGSETELMIGKKGSA